ncbi:MAG: FecR domain-containing protein [Planctomycetes bacterium]|nr:FecR domain-containing protein [Planctomycetota bacterium]
MSDADELIDAHLQGRIDDDQRLRLRAWLLEDREHQREYLRAVRFEQDLTELVRARDTRREHGYPSTRLESAHARRPRVLRGPSRWWSGAMVAAALVLMLVSAGWYVWHDTSRATGVASLVLVEASGQVEVVRDGALLASPTAGVALATGDTIKAVGDARVGIAYVDGTRLSLRSGVLVLGGADGKQIALRRGLATVRAAKQPPGSPLVIETSSARVAVVGTAFAIADIDGLTTLEVSEGSVEFAELRSGEHREVLSGQRAIAGPETAPVRSASAGERPASPRIGIELSPVQGMGLELQYLGRELMFVDLMKQATPFMPVQIDGLTDRDPGLALRSDGWVASLLPGRRAATAMCLGLNGRFPAGTYICTYVGTGTIDFAGDAKVTKRNPGRIEVAVQPSGAGGVYLQIIDLDPADPPRDIHLFAHGSADIAREQPFQAAFIQRWRGCGLLRAENWEDHGAPDQALSWSDRVTLDAGPRQVAVPAEHLLTLSDELDADLWLTIPVEADDSYVEGLAELVHRRLGDGHRVYVEYGHDVWRDGDSNNLWVAKHAVARGHASDVALERGYVDRALEVFATWRGVFGDDPRLVRVLNVDNASGEDLERRLSWRDAGMHADALAVRLTFGRPLDPAHVDDPSIADRTAADMRSDVHRLLALAAELRAHVRARGLRVIGYGAGPQKRLAQQATPEQYLRVVAMQDTPVVGTILDELLRGWSQGIGDSICCDLPTNLIHARSRCGLGEMPTDTPLATYQALLQALPPAASGGPDDSRSR